MTIMTIHKHNLKHLECVKKIAAEIGNEVKIKAYYDGETMYCLEGVHRVQAAKELQIPVVFYTVDWEDYIETDIDSGSLEYDEEGRASVESIFEYAYGNPYGCQGNVYSEDEFVSIKKV